MTKGKLRGWWHGFWASRLRVPAGILIFLAVSIAAIWWVPGILVDSAAGPHPAPALTTAERVTAVTNARQGVLFIVGGLIAVVTLLITLAKHNLDRQGQELDRDANRTTRYTEAIKQLGDKESLAIRLGGIYALERIAQDSERDRQTILDVLCAYLLAESQLIGSRSTKKSREKFPVMKSDAAAAAITIGRITRLSRPKNPIVLPSTNLSAANLTAANLNGANLTHTNLNGANLAHTNLTGANLIGANLSDAILTEANLADADLEGAKLTMTRLFAADLTAANLTRADLTAAYLAEATLNGAYLTGTYLTGTHLTEADLTEADLTRADLTNAHLTDANLTGAILTEANLAFTELTATNLSDANLTRAHLSGADLTGADLNGANLTGAYLMEGDEDAYPAMTVLLVTKEYLQDKGALGIDTVTGLPANETVESP